MLVTKHSLYKLKVAKFNFFSPLHSIEFVTLYQFSYELLIVSYKSRLYHNPIFTIGFLPFRFKGFSPTPLT